MKQWYMVNWNKITMKQLEELTGISHTAISAIYYKKRKVSELNKIYKALTNKQREEYLIPITNNGDNIIFYNDEVERLKGNISEEFNDLLEISNELNALEANDKIKTLKENINSKYELLLRFYIKDDNIKMYLENYLDNVSTCILRTWDYMNYNDEDEPASEKELNLLVLHLEKEVYKMHDLYFKHTPIAS